MSGTPSSPSGSKPPGIWEAPSLEMMQALLPQYQFISLLGRGGMGAVYKACQISLDRPVAVKVLPGDLLDDTDVNFVQRFKQEAKTMARMNHPAIVSVYDFGETQGGLLYFVMEFVDGTDVAQLILAQRRLPPEHALAITAHVCDALAYAHGHGIVHRDIKPANVLINMEGQVKVADFGLAKANDGADHGLTKTNMAMGTPDFVAPEALIPGIPLDGRADLYAVGVMLYQMLTGEIPRGLWQMPSLKVGSDARFDAIIARAMQTDREMRYQSSHEIRQDLDRIVTMPIVQAGGVSSAAIPKQAVSVPEQPKAAHPPAAASPPAPQKRKAGPLIAAVAAVGVALFCWFFFAGPKPDAAPPAATASVPATEAKPPPQTPTAAAVPPAPKPAPKAPPPERSREPVPELVAKQTLDLRALTDPVKDRVTVPNLMGKNEWLLQGQGLVYRGDGKAGKIAAPVAFKCRDYEIELHAVLRDGKARLHLDLPIGDGLIVPLILHDPEAMIIHDRGGKPWPRSGDTVHITARMRLGTGGSPDRIVVERKNHPGTLADWSGSAKTLAKKGEDHPAFSGAVGTSLFSPGGSYEVRAWTLRVFDGEARELRVSEPAVAAAPSAIPPIATPAPPLPAPAMTPEPAPAPPLAAPDAVSRRLAELEDQFQKAYDQQAGKSHQAALAQLNASFVAALDRQLVTATQSANLEEALAIRTEKERITTGQGLPPADLETLPASIKSLRATYRRSAAQKAAERDKTAAPLYDYYDQALARYQAELTQQQKLDDALRVKAKREDIAARKLKIDPGTATSTSASPPPTAGTPKKGAPAKGEAAEATGRNSRWYEATRWVVSVGGIVIVNKNGQALRVEKDSDIPAGRFDVTDISIGDVVKAAAITNDDLSRLSGLKELKSLDLAASNVTDAGFAFLPSTPALTRLTLRGMPVTDAFLDHLAPLRSLTVLQVQDAAKFEGKALAKLASLPSLTMLWLSQSGLKDEALMALKGAANLEELHIDGCLDLTDAALTPLAGLTKLRYLNIARCTRIVGSGFAEWGGKPSLKDLILSGIALEEAALPYIGSFTNLENLGIDDLKVITDDNLSLLRPLKKLRCLIALRNRITGTGFAELQGWNDLTTLLVHYETPISPAGLAVIARTFPNLNKLALGPGTTATAQDLRLLAGSKNLRNLELALPQADNQWLAAAAEISGLETLMMMESAVTSDGLAPLKSLKFLSQLYLDGCAALDDEAATTLKNLKGLKELGLRRTKISETAAAGLRKALPGCAVLR